MAILRNPRVPRGQDDKDYLLSSYRKIFIGRSACKERQEIGSSGGIGSELAHFLLARNRVQVVVGVGFKKGSPYLPEYTVIENPQEVYRIAGSKYTYMEFAPIDELLNSHREKLMAIFVQPCFVDRVRILQRKNQNIKYIFSFFCGYNITYSGTEYLINKTKIKKDDVAQLSYRWGIYPGGFSVKSKKGNRVSLGKEYYELIDLMFLRKECRDCNLYMGEGSDVALGDAWVKNLKGYSVIIARTDAGDELIREIHEQGKIKLYDICTKDLLKMHWHNLRFKKYGLGFFLSFIHGILRTKFAQRITPFSLAVPLLRLRRKFFIGINLNLREIKK